MSGLGTGSFATKLSGLGTGSFATKLSGLGTGSFATKLSRLDLSLKGHICHTWGQVYTTCLRELEKEFYEVKEQLRKMTKKYGVRMRLTRRQKDFIGLNEKIRLYIINNKPMDTKASTA